MSTSTSPESSAPKCPRLVQLEDYKKLHFSASDQIYDVHSQAVAALALLNQCEIPINVSDVSLLIRVLTQLEKWPELWPKTLISNFSGLREQIMDKAAEIPAHFAYQPQKNELWLRMAGRLNISTCHTLEFLGLSATREYFFCVRMTRALTALWTRGVTHSKHSMALLLS
ncbi:MAG: hypothetical protein DID92_2727745636 [Candidatus Nitrotoga sp. SPKER]|nr:MAG: hypothetical protein DID92_2727745636 [Candidatus Nitrotoga sp. SPKER]